ncbi:MAG: FAD-binding oxidoreductase, partial [Methanobacteriota archaeon]
FPSAKERRELAGLLEDLLGFPERPLREPVRLEDVRVPRPRIEVPSRLSETVSAGDETRIRHTYGRSYPDLVRGFGGDFPSPPDAVATPRTEDDLVALLSFASTARIAVIPYGGGTSVVAGVEPLVGDGFRGVVTVDLRRMDRVLEVDARSRSVRVEAGIRGPALNEALAPHGLALRHYPQSYEFSTVGGWIATRAGGHYATLYTHIDDFVQGVRLVAPAGTLDTGRFPVWGGGPDPNRLVLGSEGALGIVTGARLRLEPRPTFRASATVRFPELSGAVETARRVAQAKLYPADCRLLDPAEAMLHRVAFDGASVLVLAFESSDHPVEGALSRALELAAAEGGTAERREEKGGRETWRGAFFSMPYLFNALVSMDVLVDTFETVTTWDRFEALDRAVRRAVGDALASACGTGSLSMRFTHVYPDGPAPYYTFLGPATPGRELSQWATVKQAASEAILANGGSITHHHAVGRTHRPWYERQAPPEFLAALAAAKRALDPQGIMNPGALLSLDRQSP